MADKKIVREIETSEV